jgi:hypothetical protein
LKLRSVFVFTLYYDLYHRFSFRTSPGRGASWKAVYSFHYFVQNKFRDSKSLQFFANLSARSVQLVRLYNPTIWIQASVFLDTESASKQTTNKLIFHQVLFRTGPNIGFTKVRSKAEKLRHQIQTTIVDRRFFNNKDLL